MSPPAMPPTGSMPPRIPRDDSDRAVFVISVAAELAGVHPQTLRIYERRGLVDPARTSGGSRRYSERDIQRLRLIQELTTAGLNLEGVRRVLDLEEENRRLRAELARVRAEARDAIGSHRNGGVHAGDAEHGGGHHDGITNDVVGVRQIDHRCSGG